MQIYSLFGMDNRRPGAINVIIPIFGQNRAIHLFMKIAIGSDHAGFDYKIGLVAMLQQQGHMVQDFGTHAADAVDYPDIAHLVAQAVQRGHADRGVLICGSGNGVAIAANKHQCVRCALCWTEELAALARQHNDANIIAIPARFVQEITAQAMVKVFLQTAFEGGRHQRRVDKIDAGPC